MMGVISFPEQTKYLLSPDNDTIIKILLEKHWKKFRITMQVLSCYDLALLLWIKRKKYAIKQYRPTEINNMQTFLGCCHPE